MRSNLSVANHGATSPGGSVFSKFATGIAHLAGKPIAFFTAFAVIIVWAVTGPMFTFSDTWQLVVNTGTTIITFLMVFLIQNTQNRDTLALQLKLDELILATQAARNNLAGIEEETEDRLEELKKEVRSRANNGDTH